jgi:DNA-binding beta-propeller fold protein YncE
MVTKRKKKSKAAPQSRSRPKPRSGRGRRAFFALLAAFVSAALGLGLYLMNRSPAEVPVSISLAQAVGAPGVLDSPRGLSVAPDGDIYVADLGHSRIAIFGQNGVLKSTFGIRGAQGGADKPGEFNEPSGVAVGPDGTVYVADAWNERIQKFDPKGKPKGEYGGALYSFYSPRTVAVDRAGNLYVGDTGNCVVKVINPAGKLIMTLGGKGTGDGGVSREVFGVAIDAQGEIFVADHGNHRIHKYAALPSGAWIADRKVPGWAESDPFWPYLAVDGQGLVYAGDSGNGKIWVYDSNLNYRATLDGPQGQTPFTTLVGLAFSPAGDLWAADLGADKVFRIAPFNIPAPK